MLSLRVFENFGSLRPLYTLPPDRVLIVKVGKDVPALLLDEFLPRVRLLCTDLGLEISTRDLRGFILSLGNIFSHPFLERFTIAALRSLD